MTHNIIRSEAGRPLPHVQIRTGRRRRRASKLEVVNVHLVAAGVGIAAGLADVAIGQPVCIVIVGVAFAAWCVWPSR